MELGFRDWGGKTPGIEVHGWMHRDEDCEGGIDVLYAFGMVRMRHAMGGERDLDAEY